MKAKQVLSLLRVTRVTLYRNCKFDTLFSMKMYSSRRKEKLKLIEKELKQG